jgi:glycosyltransferase involved in cell wall biosynthesis
VRIAVYLPAIAPNEGGAFTFQKSIFESLAELAPTSSHEFLVYCRGSASAPARNVRTIETRRGLAKSVRARTSVLLRDIQDRNLGRRPVDVTSWFEASVHAEGVDAVWFPTTQFEECELPYVYTIWDMQHLVQPWFPEISAGGEWTARDAMFRKNIRRALRTIVPNRTAAQEVMTAFGIPESRLLLLPHPTPRIESPSTEEIERVLRKYSLTRGYLFYPAQFWAHKNHVNLLHALKLLRDGGSDDKLVFCGSDKGNEGHVRAVAESLGLTPHVRSLGFVPDADLAALYGGAFALTFTSFFGPENLPPLEAFTVGCPVVSSEYAGAREQLGDAALFVAPEDPQQIAAAVQELQINAQLRETLIARGRERSSRWSGSDYVAGVLSFFDQFAAVRRCWP